MPLVHRVTMDMFEFAEVIDYMCNPVNLLGVPGAGLALEFRNRAPDYVERYREACRDHSLRIGTVQVLEDVNQPWGIINFPTKRHYAEHSNVSDIIRGLEAMKDLLSQDFYRYASVGMPMLGCGLGKQDYPTVQPLMEQFFTDLDACVFLSMSPERTEMRPRYLTISGPVDYGKTSEQQQEIDETIDKAMSAWGMSLSDYTGIVSGGYPGVDSYICGTDYGKTVESSIPYQDTYVWRKTEKMPLVVKPNSARDGVGASVKHGSLLCEIGDDVILFKPQGCNNNRMVNMQTWLDQDKRLKASQGKPQKRVAIKGDVSHVTEDEGLIIPY